MSILIKGMEMPKNCFDCPCYHHKVDDGYYDYEICRASGTVFNDVYSSVTGHKDHINPFKARLDNCPLVEIPPHGRLGDLDALVKRLESEKAAKQIDNYDYWYALSVAVDFALAAPTIIPAEEETE